MAKEGSIAPEERINIIYKPAKDGEVQGELPLNILVLGDFKGRPEETLLEDRNLMKVSSKEDFRRELAAQHVSLDLSVPDRLTNTPGQTLNVRLKFNTMADFGPEGLLKQIPALQELKRQRDALSGLKSPLENQPSFRRLLNDLVSDMSTQLSTERDRGN